MYILDTSEYFLRKHSEAFFYHSVEISDYSARKIIYLILLLPYLLQKPLHAFTFICHAFILGILEH